MQTTLFSVRAVLPNSAVISHAAPETLPIWSVVMTRITTSDSATITTEMDLASCLRLTDAFALLLSALTQYVAPTALSNN